MKSSAAGSKVAVPLLASPVAASSAAFKLSCSSTIGLADRRRVLQDPGQIRARVAVDVGDRRGAAKIVLQRGKFRIHLLQIVVQPGQQCADVVAVAAQPFTERRQRGVEVDRVDLAQQVGQRLEQRVDLQLHAVGLDLGARAQRLAVRILRGQELDRLGAEDRGAARCARGRRRDVAQVIAV